MEIRIKKVQVGTNEEGFPIIAPETQPPRNYIACEITDGEYLYILDVPEQEPGSNG